MNDPFQDLIDERRLEEFEYRLVYLRPSYYSDEQIAVGLVATNAGRLEARFISSSLAIETMSRLIGDDGVEQFQFAAGELRRVISRLSALDSLDIPTDTLVVGDKISAVTPDRNGLLGSVLDAASCLVRHPNPKNGEVTASSASNVLIREMFEHVSRLNPMVANDIFNKKVKVDGDTVEVPIFGRRVLGAPVSFASSAQIMRAESYVAKFHWLGQHFSQIPKVYVVVPDDDKGGVTKAESRLRELSSVAKASRVEVVTAANADELAHKVIRDEVMGSSERVPKRRRARAVDGAEV
jgi:hypothetical protein